MTKIIEQLEGKFFKLYEALEHENEALALKTLKAIHHSMLTLSKISQSELDKLWHLVEKIFALCNERVKEMRNDVREVLQKYKVWQEASLLDVRQPLLTYHDALLIIAKLDKASHMLPILGDLELFSSDLDMDIQVRLTQLITQERYTSALRYAVALLERQPSAEGYIALGEIALKGAHANKARQFFQQALEYDAQSPEANVHLGRLMGLQSPLDAVPFYQNAINEFYQRVQGVVDSEQGSVAFAKKMLMPMCELMVLPIESEIMEWALLSAQHLLKLSERQLALKCTAFFLTGLVYAVKGHVYSATSHFRQSAIADTEHYIEQMQATHLVLQSAPTIEFAVYQQALEGLYDELSKRNDFPLEHAWGMAKCFDEEGDRFQADLARAIAYKIGYHGGALSVEDKAAFIKGYIKWIQVTYLNHRDYFHATQHWYKLLEIESVDALTIEDDFLNQLEEAFIKRDMPWPYAYKQKKVEPAVVSSKLEKADKTSRLNKVAEVVEKESDSIRVPRLVSAWLNEIERAIHQQKTPAKKTDLTTCDITGVEKYILERFQAVGAHKKHYPNVLDAIEVLLNLTQSDAHEGLYLKLAKQYEYSHTTQAIRLYERILEKNSTAVDAYFSLARIAYANNQCALAKRYLKAVPESDPKFASLYNQINEKEAGWAAKLNKLRANRMSAIDDFSKIGAFIQECEAFMRHQVGADTYLDAMLELGILKLLREQKKSDVKSVDEFNQCAIDVSGFERVILLLQDIATKLPDSFDAAYWLGIARKSAGKLFQAVIDNSWALEEQQFAERRSILEGNMRQFYSDAIVSFIHAASLVHPNRLNAIWERAQLQEQAGEYMHAKDGYSEVYAGFSPYSQRARVKLAHLSYKMGHYDVALDCFRSIDEDMEWDSDTCTKTTLNYFAGLSAKACGLSTLAIHFMEAAKLHAESTSCHDFEGLQLLLGNTDVKEFLPAVKILVAGKPALQGLPVVMQCGHNFYFHDNHQGVLESSPINLGAIQRLLNEDGISLAPRTMLLLKSGDYSQLYKHIQMKKGWLLPVLAWKTTVLQTIQEQLEALKVQDEEHKSADSVALAIEHSTLDNRYRFSCARSSGVSQVKEEDKQIGLTPTS